MLHSLFVLLLIGCTTKESQHTSTHNRYIHIPTNEIQINSIPHPLNINGWNPYVVWVNGERLNLNTLQVRELAISLGLPLDVVATPEMHAGAGWTKPLNLTKK